MVRFVLVSVLLMLGCTKKGPNEPPAGIKDEQRDARAIEEEADSLAKVSEAVYKDQLALTQKELSADFFCPKFSETQKYRWTSRGFSQLNAALLGEASFLSYFKLSDFHKRVSEWASERGPIQTAAIVIEETDTQVYLAWNEIADGKGFVLVDFRGTSSKRDFLTDAQFVKAPRAHSTWGKIHQGFEKSYGSIRNALFAKLESLGGTCINTQDMSRPVIDRCTPAREIIVTGHSLGGALATLFAGDVTTEEISSNNPTLAEKLLLHKDESGDSRINCQILSNSLAVQDAGVVPPRMITAVYTFGSPRVGGRNYSQCFTAALDGAHYRVSYANDVVSRVPNFAYLHVGSTYHFYARSSDGTPVPPETKATDLQRQGAAANPIGEFYASLRELGSALRHLLSTRRDVLVNDHLAYPAPLRAVVESSCSPGR